MKIDLRSARLSSRGFLNDYLIYTEKQESPSDFHLWVGIGVVSAVLNRQVWYDRGHFKLYPNLWTVLVAESGMLSKSTALRIGTNMIREAVPKHNFFAEKITNEGLIGHLAELTKEVGRAICTISASEFSVFFGNQIKDQGLIQTLTDLYDCPGDRVPWIYKTRQRGEEALSNVCLTMIAGSTPEWLRMCLPEEAVGGGFASRLIMIPRFITDRKVAFPEDYYNQPEILRARDICISDLAEISLLNGEYKMTEEARELYQLWYEDMQPKGMAKLSQNLRGYYSRKRDYIIKIAMIASASRSASMLIDGADILFATKILNENETYLNEIAKQMGTSDEGKTNSLVEHFIMNRGSVTMSELMANFSYKLNAMQLANVIRTLEEAGKISQTLNMSRSKKGVRMLIWEGGRKDKAAGK